MDKCIDDAQAQAWLKANPASFDDLAFATAKPSEGSRLGRISVLADRVEFEGPGLFFARSSDLSETFFDELRGLLKLNGS